MVIWSHMLSIHFQCSYTRVIGNCFRVSVLLNIIVFMIVTAALKLRVVRGVATDKSAIFWEHQFLKVFKLGLLSIIYTFIVNSYVNVLNMIVLQLHYLCPGCWRYNI